MNGTLPEITEAEASGEIAALYDTIRRDTGSGLVNYIWRHLATIGGAAPWAWAFARANDTRPLARKIAADADAAAARIAKAPPSARPVALDAEAEAIVAVYNANNVGNLARVMLLRDALRRKGAPVAGVAAAPPASRAPAPPQNLAIPPRNTRLPALPGFHDLSTEDLRLVERLADAGPASDSGVIPSLWRHLAVRPGLLERLVAPTRTLLASQPFSEAFTTLREEAMQSAAAQEVVLPALADFDRVATLDSLDRFSRRIAELTLCGRVLALWSRAG